MQSMNNIYVAVGEPIKRYIKTVDYPITGWRIDPDTDKQVEFILSTPIPDFNYDDAVLEFYTEKDFQFFRQKNKYLIEKGLVKEFEGQRAEADTTNLLTDSEIEQVAIIRTPSAMSKRLNELTSELTVQRVLEVAKEIGRPAKTLAIIQERLKELKPA